MRETKITANDVARAAGVSQPTVSRVFSNSPAVSAEKAARVRQAAMELGYIPNTLARSLNSGKSYNIGIILAHLKNGFFADALQRLTKALNAKGYRVTVYFAANMSEEINDIVHDLLAHQVDGIILASVSVSNELTARLKNLGLPFVLFNRGQEDPDISQITASNFEGARNAVSFLAMAGCKRIAHLAGWKEALNGQERQAGYLAALSEAGLEPYACVDCHFRRQVAMEHTRKWFEGGTGPDAIFVANDHMAFGVLEVLRNELKLRVPEDVSVIGYDDAPMASWQVFDLTTVRQPIQRMVDTAVDVLIERLVKGEVPSQRIEIESNLVIRSTARIPQNWPVSGNLN